jgi:5-methylcytosine-specific restriction endonuclease McrA
MTRPCTQCGLPFTASATGGRPRSRCDSCRTNHAKIDGTRWRKLRAQVLWEQPVCAVAGCGRPSRQVDHVVALARGGDPYDRGNLQGMCASHNASKGDRSGLPDSSGWCTDPKCTHPWDCDGPFSRWHA